MAVDYIKIDTTGANAIQASELKQWVGLTRQVYEIADRIRDKMTHMYAGTDFAALEMYYGLPAGKGQMVFDLLNGSVGAMEGTFQNNNIKTVTETLG
jgi:maltose-binding protein MalE